MIKKIEHLKNWVGLVIDAYQEGHGTKHPMDPAMAKALIWNELERILSMDIKLGKYKPVWLRIGDIKDKVDFLKNMELYTVESLRWLGPREQGGDTTVAYVVFKIRKVEELRKIVFGLVNYGYTVRDGTFGAYVT